MPINRNLFEALEREFGSVCIERNGERIKKKPLPFSDKYWPFGGGEQYVVSCPHCAEELRVPYTLLDETLFIRSTPYCRQKCFYLGKEHETRVVKFRNRLRPIAERIAAERQAKRRPRNRVTE